MHSGRRSPIAPGEKKSAISSDDDDDGIEASEAPGWRMITWQLDGVMT